MLLHIAAGRLGDATTGLLGQALGEPLGGSVGPEDGDQALGPNALRRGPCAGSGNASQILISFAALRRVYAVFLSNHAPHV